METTEAKGPNFLSMSIIQLRPASAEDSGPDCPSLADIMQRLGVRRHGGAEALLGSLPFSPGDVTAGTESELQAAVIGQREAVDLPLVIEQSNYFANIARHAAAGETSRRLVSRLEAWLEHNASGLWENSWVRFPRRRLNRAAEAMLQHDLKADKSRADSPARADVEQFLFAQHGEPALRLPISYLIKLALAQFLGSPAGHPPLLQQTGRRLLGHFLNDNSSPETFSFHVMTLDPAGGMGQAVGREKARRFLLTHLLVAYANEAFGLRAAGQQATVYFSPLPPVRQKRLNDCISDAFYRELFMSPCLSGWDEGEAKHRYMHLCHQVLSRSQLNAVAKLREAGIITRNLVVMPNLSNVSLANNGTHLSLGSRKLTALLKDPASGLGRAAEKVLGDLVTKVVEHFLPLFVGAYSAAPARIDFQDFHPERLLGFLPHELDYTHLRQLWRRWRKKAHNKVLGHGLTPFGPPLLDRAASALLGLRGDCVPDLRLLDYLVALLSTDRSPALDGRLGNTDRLRRDLADLGVFDAKMACYMPFRMRECAAAGYFGFEGRTFSQFEHFGHDLGHAANLQTLVTALAVKYIARGLVTHADIPDTPHVESERRQVFFCAATGVRVFNVRQDTPNTFLKRLLARTELVKPSLRYHGSLKVQVQDYRRALLRVLREDAADLIDMFGLQETMDDLARRIEAPEEHAASGRLTRGILEEAGASSPMRLSAEEFGQAAERYYRGTLKRRHLGEALEALEEDLTTLARPGRAAISEGWGEILQGEPEPAKWVRRAREALLADQADEATLARLIALTLAAVGEDARRAQGPERMEEHEPHQASVC